MSQQDEEMELQFHAAVDRARITNNVSSDNKKKLYGLYKQVTEGPIGHDTARPGIFDPVGRAKYDSWSALGTMSKEEAMKQYVTLVNSL
jgi:acyl-CoA-binding protein